VKKTTCYIKMVVMIKEACRKIVIVVKIISMLKLVLGLVVLC
jgi:hypothetical protein